MAFFDKLKETASSVKEKATATASNATQKVKEQYEANKQAREEKKAAEEAYKAEMTEKAKAAAERIIEAVNANEISDEDGFFNGKDKKEVFKYTKDFFEKLLLPANSKDKTYISMYPYISKKISDKIIKTFAENIPYDVVLMDICDKEGQEILLTYDKLFFKTSLEEDKKFPIVGSISTSKVSKIELKKDEDSYVLLCDNVEIIKILINAGKESDFVALSKYFNDIKNSDYEITDDEIDSIIKEKIGAFTTTEIENECDDDEKLQFFTYNSSGGYVVCTTEKIIVADKQSNGNVSNMSRYYYDEIKNIETKQDATNLGDTPVSSSLGGMLFEMAAQAAIESAVDSFLKDVCDLVINGEGIHKRMSGMVKIEADRIVSIFNRFKKENRSAEKAKEAMAAQPQVIIKETQSQPDVLEQIEKLAKLKEAGILTEEEFNQKKLDLLAKI